MFLPNLIVGFVRCTQHDFLCTHHFKWSGEIVIHLKFKKVLLFLPIRTCCTFLFFILRFFFSPCRRHSYSLSASISHHLGTKKPSWCSAYQMLAQRGVPPNMLSLLCSLTPQNQKLEFLWLSHNWAFTLTPASCPHIQKWKPYMHI